MTVATRTLLRSVPARQALQGADPHHRVAVHELAALVDRDQPIGVAVEGQAEVEPGCGNRLGQPFWVRRPTTVVDVRSVRGRRTAR